MSLLVSHDFEGLKADPRPSAVAIGNFDGCHLGHQHLIQTMLEAAKLRNLRPTVLTFYPHPVEVLNPSKKLERLMTTQEKLKFLEFLGVECVFVAPFTKEVAELSPEQFFQRYLRDGLKAASVHVGFNFRFGKNRAGDVTLLKRECESNGIALQVLPAFTIQGEKVSSSAIRKWLQEGEVTRAKDFLGHPYVLSGNVVRGDNRGEQLGFPTANLDISTEKVLPRNGVYVTRARWQKQFFRSVTNIGVRPTFGESSHPRPLIEVHFIDVHPKLYQEWIQLELWQRVRDEVKFPSREALMAQIQKDVDLGRTFNFEV